jgi:hypothetical protein
VKRAARLRFRASLVFTTLAAAVVCGCLNPRPDDLPSSQPVSSAPGDDSSSPGLDNTSAGAGNGNESGTPRPEGPGSDQPGNTAAPADAGAASDAASNEPSDAAADAGPTEADGGVQ